MFAKPQIALTSSEKADAYVKEFKCFKKRGFNLVCTLCSVQVSFKTPNLIIHRINTQKCFARSVLSTKRTLFIHKHAANKYFATDFCNSFLEANIALLKLSNLNLIKLIKANANKMRSNYVTSTYKEKFNNLRQNINDRRIFISVDKTIDFWHRYVANGIVGNWSTDNIISFPLISSLKGIFLQLISGSGVSRSSKLWAYFNIFQMNLLILSKKRNWKKT